jgi:hypothetical protein
MWQEPDPVDQLLDHYERESFEDEGEALAAVALAAEAIGQGLEGIEGEERERRLRRWLNRLQKLAAKAADEVEAVSFTVSVGIPAGASVSFHLARQELGGLARSGRHFRRPPLRPAEPDGPTADRRTRSSGPRVAPAQTRPRTPRKPGPPKPQPVPEPQPRDRSSIAGPQAPIRLQPRSPGKLERPPTDSAA